MTSFVTTMKQPATFMSVVVRVGFLLSASLPATETTPISSGRQDDHNRTHRSTETYEELYNKLREAGAHYEARERLMEEFEPNAYCPIKVVRVGNITRTMCDWLKIKNCNSGDAYCKDISDNCHQAYLYLGDIQPSVRKGRREKVEVDCKYHPKRVGVSMESAEPHYESDIVS